MGIGAVSAEYPYWIEDIGDGQYNIWTKINISAGESKTIYVQKQDGYSPDGNTVFEFFDDFEGTSLDNSKWTIGSGTWSVVNGNLKTSIPEYSNAVVGANTQASDRSIVEMKGSWTGCKTGHSWLGILIYQSSIASLNTGYPLQFGRMTDNVVDIEKFRITHLSWTPITYTQGDLKKIKAIAVPGNLKAVYDDSISVTSTDTTYTTGYVGIRVYNANAQVDYFFVRKYAENEPEITKVEQIQDGYRFYIHNPNNQDLNGFQIGIPSSGTVDGTNYDLGITDKDKLNIITYDEIERKPIPTIYINSNQTATATLTINGAPIVLSVNGTSKTLDVETANLIETYGANEIKLLNTNPKSSVHLSVKYNYNTPIYVAKLRPINISAYTDYN